MRALICLALVAFMGISLASPSDLIQTAPSPGKIALSGTVAESVKAIDATNPELVRGMRWDTRGIGYLDSANVVIDQDAEPPVGVPEKLLNFSSYAPANLTSIGNATDNITIINDTMVWY